jgi:hypothetical protein
MQPYTQQGDIRHLQKYDIQYVDECTSPLLIVNFWIHRAALEVCRFQPTYFNPFASVPPLRFRAAHTSDRITYSQLIGVGSA